MNLQEFFDLFAASLAGGRLMEAAQVDHVHRNVYDKTPIELLGTPKATLTTT